MKMLMMFRCALREYKKIMRVKFEELDVFFVVVAVPSLVFFDVG